MPDINNKEGRSPVEKPLAGKKVLIVDDEVDLRDMLSYGLSKFGGATTAVAKNGNEALEHLQSSQQKPDIVITDLQMPGMDGKKLAEEIRKLPEFENIPIIMVSGTVSDLNEEKLEKKAKEMRVEAVIAKPFVQMPDLPGKISKIIQEKSLRQSD